MYPSGNGRRTYRKSFLNLARSTSPATGYETIAEIHHEDQNPVLKTLQRLEERLEYMHFSNCKKCQYKEKDCLIVP